MAFLRDLGTADADSRVWDLVRVGTGISLLVGLGLITYAVVRGDAFDIQSFGIGVGSLLAGGGGAMAMRRDREAPPKGE